MSRTRRRFSILPLAAALLLLAGMGAILMPVLQMDREIRRDVEEYAQLREAASLPAEAPPRPPDADAEGNPLDCRVQPSAAPPDRFTGVDLAACQVQNGDFIAWLSIPGTPIDYPVVRAADNDYYLGRDVEKRKSAYGAIFMDFRNADPAQQKHIILYGHNMKNGTMFHDLMNYKQKSFFDEHRIINLLWDGVDTQWEIFVAYIIKPNTIYHISTGKSYFGQTAIIAIPHICIFIIDASSIGKNHFRKCIVTIRFKLYSATTGTTDGF